MIACPLVTTGERVLAETLSHLDCQAQSLGSFGFQSLATPGSPASFALTGLLTLFIALFALRMLLGEGVEGRDAVNAILKLGIVMTLAVSWPAFRTLAYDTVLLAPAEVAASVTPSTLPETSAGFNERLQNIDSGIATLTLLGAGWQNGSLALDQRGNDAFRTVAIADSTALGWARTIYLSSVIGSLAVLRIAGGLLLALAPLMAGLLLFDFSRGVFAGWVRGLLLVALGALGITLVLAVEVAVVEPWLADVLQRRASGYATPSAPTELLAFVIAFAAASAGLLAMLGKVAFHNAWSIKIGRAVDQVRDRLVPAAAGSRPVTAAAQPIEIRAHARALSVSEGVTNLIRHEEARRGAARVTLALPSPEAPSRVPGAEAQGRIGSSWRRTSGRTTAAHRQRDSRS
jgi:type IV secretion system protein VirB6